MAIDDNTSYELTGAQVKDLASKINAKANTTDLPSVMTGATSQAAGTSGLVPAPTTSDVDKYLKGDGTWTAVSSSTTATAVVLHSVYDSANETHTLYHDSAHTEAVTYSELAQLLSNDSVIIHYDDYENLPHYLTVVSSFLDGTNETDFYAFDSVSVYLYRFSWQDGDSYLSWVQTDNVRGHNVWYGTCSSSASSTTKSVSISYSGSTGGDFALKTGTTIFVKFSNNNTAANFTLDVNSTGSKGVFKNGGSLYAGGDYMWKGGDVVGFTYDGSYWCMIDSDRASSIYWGKVKLAASYTSSSSDTVPTSSHLYSVYNIANNKQDQLIAGQGISISGNTISATGGSYTYSGSVDTINNSFTTTLSDGTTTQDVTLNAGTGITFSSSSSGPSIVGPTPANTSTDATQISSLTFTPGAAGTGYFYVLRVGKSSSMSGDVYSARLYKSNQSFNFTSQAEVEAAIWPNGQQIDVNPNNSGTMSGFFDSSFQTYEYVSGKSTAAEAIAAVYTAEATFGGTVTFDSQHVYVDAYVYVMGQGASTLTISATSNVVQTTGQSTTDVMSQKAVTDIIGNVETILQTLNSGTGAQ